MLIYLSAKLYIIRLVYLYTACISRSFWYSKYIKTKKKTTNLSRGSRIWLNLQGEKTHACTDDIYIYKVADCGYIICVKANQWVKIKKKSTSLPLLYAQKKKKNNTWCDSFLALRNFIYICVHLICNPYNAACVYIFIRWSAASLSDSIHSLFSQHT